MAKTGPNDVRPSVLLRLNQLPSLLPLEEGGRTPDEGKQAQIAFLRLDGMVR